jgi:hypothetical protein
MYFLETWLYFINLKDLRKIAGSYFRAEKSRRVNTNRNIQPATAGRSPTLILHCVIRMHLSHAHLQSCQLRLLNWP